MKTKAVKKGDKYVISGSKCFITNGTYADYFTVYAKTDPEAGHRGISAFVVDADLPGVSVDKKEDKMGQRASNTATISFDEVEIPAENLLGEENKGFKLAMMTLDRTRPGVSAMAVGIGRAALEYATEYSKERVQFGVPIAMHQAIQFMIADMATKVEAARLLVWNSAVLLDQGVRNSKVSSMAKRFAADSAMEITVDAVQVYGGYGFIKEYPVEKLMRDAKIMQLYEGTSQIQRLVIAKEVLLPRSVDEPTPEAEAKAKAVREQPVRAGGRDGLVTAVRAAGIVKAVGARPAALFVVEDAQAARALERAVFWRRVLSSSTLRRRIDSGVTSTHSSSRRNSTAASRERRLGGRHALQHVGAGGAHVGLLLLLDRVDVHVLGAGVLADDHPLVDLLAGADEEGAAVLQADQRVAGGLAAAVGDDRAGGAEAQLAGPALPALEDVVHDAGAAGLGEELGAQADQARAPAPGIPSAPSRWRGWPSAPGAPCAPPAAG